MNRERARQIIRASWIGIVVNAALAVAKIVVGVLDSSFAVISDGIDSGTDIVTSTVALIAAYVSLRPPDRRFPFGYGRAETVATKLLAFFIFFSGFQLVVAAVRNLVAGSSGTIPGIPALVISSVSIVVKMLLTVYKRRLGRRLDSELLLADARNMQNDIIISAAVIIGVTATQVLEMPLIDTLTALAVSVWIIKTALQIYFLSTTELMDGVDNPEVYRKVFEAVERVPAARNPHRVRVRKLGNLYAIILDIEVAHDLTVVAAHRIAQATEAAIKDRLDAVYDVVVHLEPSGNDERDESYGVCAEDIYIRAGDG